MKWRLVITGEGPALNEPAQPNDADHAAAGLVELLTGVPGQTVHAATFQVDSNNKDLLKERKKALKAAKPPAPEPPQPPV